MNGYREVYHSTVRLAMTSTPLSTPAPAHSVEPPTEPSEPRVSARTEPHDPAEMRRRRRRLFVVSAVVLTTVVLATSLLAGMVSLFGRSKPSGQSLVLFTVARRELPIKVIERGTVESQKNVQVVCGVDDIDGDGINGTTILWIVENGSFVHEGDLVVELDTASHIDRLESQVLKAIYARGQFQARTLDYENRKTINETIQANAELALKMAKLELLQYEDEQGGTFQMALQNVDLSIQQQATRRQIDERNLAGTEQLHELGYKSKGDLAQAKLRAMRARSAVKREESRRLELMNYSYARSKLRLEGAVATAERALQQVKLNNDAALAQAKVWLKMAELGKTWHEARLAGYQVQLKKCKLYAPQDGMVAYHVESSGWGRTSTVAEGVAVRNRQIIMSIPDLRYIQIKTSVHETVVDRVKAGMPAKVHIDAFPDRRYDATVDSVDVLPDPGGWLNSDTKVYETIVTIAQEVDLIKPGMTAVVEIHITDLHDVLCVPIQAIVQRGPEASCFVAERGRVTRCPVKLGIATDSFVEIRAGLASGDQVVLNLDAIADAESSRRDIAPDRENTESYSLE